MLRLTVTAAQRADPRFIELLKNSEAFFNCRKHCCFNDKFRSLLCLHEGAHAYFAREVGARNIKFQGPEMFWDSRPEYDCPAISKSSVSWDEPRGGFDAEVAKANLAGFICRREMSDTPNDEIAISADFAVCRERFNRHIGAGEDAFKLLIKDVEKELPEDLWSPQTRREIWAEAKSFEKEVFPSPKLTAALLRERRLGWMNHCEFEFPRLPRRRGWRETQLPPVLQTQRASVKQLRDLTFARVDPDGYRPPAPIVAPGDQTHLHSPRL